MDNRLQNFSEELVPRICHFLWRQWGQLGVASADVERRDGWMIDPEALLLLSCTYARHDARLFDETMDWLLKNASFVNTARLKSTARKFNFSGERVMMAVLSRVAKENKRLHWSASSLEALEDPEPLFLDSNGNPLPDFGCHDESFLKTGYLRGEVDLRGLSRRFNPVMPECTILKLRALFGSVARADILAYLLSHGSAHPSRIARDTGFSQKNVQDTLVDMAASGIVTVGKLEGRKKCYFMHEKYRSCFLHNGDKASSPRWIAWLPIFRALDLLLPDLRRILSMNGTITMQASMLRDLQEKLEPLLCPDVAPSLFSELAMHTGESYLPSFIEALDEWLAIVLGEDAASTRQ